MFHSEPRCMWGDYTASNKLTSTFKDDYKPYSILTPYCKPVIKPAFIFPQNAGAPTLSSHVQCSFRTPGHVTKDKAKVVHSIHEAPEKDDFKQTFCNISKGMINPDRRSETRSTTSRSEFMPVLKEFTRVSHRKDLADSEPLGNRVFDPSVMSEYAGVYQRKEMSKRKGFTYSDIPGEKIFSINKSLLAGNCHKCVTLPPHELTSKKPITKSVYISSIPKGDPDKVAHFLSNNKSSYEDYFKQKDTTAGHHSDFFPELPTAKCHHIIQSSIQMGDRRLSDGYKTIAMEDFVHHKAGRASTPIHNSYDSSIPRGDMNPQRVREAMNFSSSRSSYSTPSAESYTSRVNTVGLLSLSHVPLGEPDVTCKSTMEDSYPSHSQVPICGNIIPPCRSLVIEYYPKKTGISTMKEEYIKSDEGNRVDMSHIRNLKQTHWAHPYMESRSFATTHRESFLPPRTYN